MQTDEFVLDYAKAFDSVPHESFKAKLNSYGISGSILHWVDAFLCERYQRVCVNGTMFQWARLTSGIAHGIVFGPILFNLFINEITEAISSEIRLFADGCICCRIIKSNEDCEELQRDICRLAAWACPWCISFQPTKCKMIGISRKPARMSLIHTTFMMWHWTWLLKLNILG